MDEADQLASHDPHDREAQQRGEHGVGLHKMQFMAHEHGEDALDLMRALKTAFDPKNILNPGKIIAPKVQSH